MSFHEYHDEILWKIPCNSKSHGWSYCKYAEIGHLTWLTGPGWWIEPRQRLFFRSRWDGLSTWSIHQIWLVPLTLQTNPCGHLGFFPKWGDPELSTKLYGSSCLGERNGVPHVLETNRNVPWSKDRTWCMVIPSLEIPCPTWSWRSHPTANHRQRLQLYKSSSGSSQVGNMKNPMNQPDQPVVFETNSHAGFLGPKFVRSRACNRPTCHSPTSFVSGPSTYHRPERQAAFGAWLMAVSARKVRKICCKKSQNIVEYHRISIVWIILPLEMQNLLDYDRSKPWYPSFHTSS